MRDKKKIVFFLHVFNYYYEFRFENKNQIILIKIFYMNLEVTRYNLSIEWHGVLNKEILYDSKILVRFEGPLTVRFLHGLSYNSK